MVYIVRQINTLTAILNALGFDIFYPESATDGTFCDILFGEIFLADDSHEQSSLI